MRVRGWGEGAGGLVACSHTQLPTTKSAIATRYVCNCMHKYNQISKSAISNLSIMTYNLAPYRL